jgi:hypothetical protein
MAAYLYATGGAPGSICRKAKLGWPWSMRSSFGASRFRKNGKAGLSGAAVTAGSARQMSRSSRTISRPERRAGASPACDNGSATTQIGRSPRCCARRSASRESDHVVDEAHAECCGVIRMEFSREMVRAEADDDARPDILTKSLPQADRSELGRLSLINGRQIFRPSNRPSLSIGPLIAGGESSSLLSASKVDPRARERSPGGAGGFAQPGERGCVVRGFRTSNEQVGERVQSARRPHTTLLAGQPRRTAYR